MTALPNLAEQKADESRNLPAFREFSLPGFRDQITHLLAMIGNAGIFNTYTRHDITHIDAMLRMLKWLVPEPTQQKMTHADWLLIVLAVYLHDLGMLVTQEEYEGRKKNAVYQDWLGKIRQDERDRDYLARARAMGDEEQERFFFQEYIRAGHAARIGEWITNKHSRRWNSELNAAAAEVHRLLQPLPYRFRQYLATVCESHHEDKLDDMERFPLYAPVGTDPEREWVNVQYAAILLRTTDLLHVTRDRTPTVMFKQIKFTDPRGVAEWEKQKGTFAVTPRTRKLDLNDPSTAEIQVSADFSEERPLFALQEYIVYANAQVEQSRRWAEKSLESGDTEYLFPWRAVKGDVQLEGVKPFPLKFELDRGRLLDLLVGHTLYNDPTVAVRELLQNAIDAVRYQHHLDRRQASAGRPAPQMGVVRIIWEPKERRLIVEDTGVGMSRDVIENHLMKVGSSFYNTPSFEAEYGDFTPISRFGIGILTCFMVSDNIEIVTCRDWRGHRIRMTSVHADYLRRELQPFDRLLAGIDPHGTRVTLTIRNSIDLEEKSILDIVRYWVILPECRVEYIEQGKTTEQIGFASAREALEHYHRQADVEKPGRFWKVEVVEKHRQFPRDGDGPTGEYDLAIAVQSGWFPEREFALITPGDPPAVCVEGIRVSNWLPCCVRSSDRTQSVSALLSVRGNRALRTTVSRADLEDDPTTSRLGRLCLKLTMEYVRDEVDRISVLPGRPLSQASSACQLLSEQLRRIIANSFSADYWNTRDDLPTLVVEHLIENNGQSQATRKLQSRNELEQLKEFWSVESRLVDSLGLISRDLGRELSLNEFTTALAPDAAHLRYSPLIPDADLFQSELIRSHQPTFVRFSRINQQTAIRWNDCLLEADLRTDLLIDYILDEDMLSQFREMNRNESISVHEHIFIWIMPIEGDSGPPVDVIQTRFGILLRKGGMPAMLWGSIRKTLLYLIHLKRIEDLRRVFLAAMAFESIHTSEISLSDDPVLWWSYGLPILREVLGKLEPRTKIPDKLEKPEPELIFDARQYWRDWRGVSRY